MRNNKIEQLAFNAAMEKCGEATSHICEVQTNGANSERAKLKAVGCMDKVRLWLEAIKEN